MQETKHLSTDADCSTHAKKILLIRQNLLYKQFFFARQFYTLYKQNCSNLRKFLSINFLQGFQKYQKVKLKEKIVK